MRKIDYATTIALATMIFLGGGFYYTTQKTTGNLEEDVEKLQEEIKNNQIEIAKLQQSNEYFTSGHHMADSIVMDSLKRVQDSLYKKEK